MLLLCFCFSFGLSQAQDRPTDPINPIGGGRNGSTFPSDTTTVKKRTGKILDDSTKAIYGAHSTKYFYESDWFYNTYKKRQIDTLMHNFHRYNFVQRNNNDLQDLGNFATAGRRIYYQAPNQIGVRLGITAFDYLLTQSEEIKYYDTKSPHSSWYLVLGGQGRSFLDASLAQNINPRVNVGFRYRRLTNKTLLGNKKIDNNNRHADFQDVLMHTSIESANGRYKLMANFSGARQKLLETGGLEYSDTLTDLRDLYGLEQGGLNNLFTVAGDPGADGLYQRSKLHLYHQFSLVDSSNFQVYHEFNQTYIKSSFADASIDTIPGVYDNFYLADGVANHQVRYDESDNKIGLKWRKHKLFMASYFRLKSFGFAHFPQAGEQASKNVDTQSFVGAIGNYSINDSTELDFSAEYLLFKDYRLSVILRTKLFEAHYKRSFFEPSLIDQYYYGNQFQWQNSFENTIVDEIGGNIPLKFGKHQIRPFAKLQRIENLIYSDESALPAQSGTAISLVQVGLQNKGKVGSHWHYNGQFTFTQNDAESQLPMPDMMAQLQIYYQKQFFDGAFPAQIGLDGSWNSAYFAPAYQPVLQRFYLQDRFQIGNYPAIDFFVNGTIQSATIFLKVTNILQPLLGEGYFSTIGYMAQPTQFEFGFRWMFYD